jgi:hypothetical protein
MDFVDIRLSSADEQAVRRLQATLRETLPGIRFGRTRLGRSGDWMCDGHYDAATVPVRSTPPSDEQDRLTDWFHAYKTIRPVLVRLLGHNHQAIQHLDRAMVHAASWTIGRSR